MIPVDIDKRVLQSWSVSQLSKRNAYYGCLLDKLWFPRIVVSRSLRSRMAAGQPLRVRSTNHGRSQTCHSRPTHAARAELSDRERRARKRAHRLVRRQECGQRVKLGTLNVDLEHVDESVAWKIRLVRRDKGAERGSSPFSCMSASRV
jgi:hypothetical protein